MQRVTMVNNLPGHKNASTHNSLSSPYFFPSGISDTIEFGCSHTFDYLLLNLPQLCRCVGHVSDTFHSRSSSDDKR